MKSPTLTHRERDLLTALLQGDARMGFKIGNSWTLYTKAGTKRVGQRSVQKLIDLGHIRLDVSTVMTLTLTTEGLQLMKETRGPQ